MRRIGCILLLCYVIQSLSLNLVAAEQREFSLSVSPSDMKVDGGGRVFLAVGSQLFRLDSTLSLQGNVTLGSSVVRVALSSDERRVVVCLGDLSCAVYNASDFGAGAQLRRTDASDSSDMVALFTAEENSFYVGSFRRGAFSFNLGQYGFGNRNLVRFMDYNTFLRGNFQRMFFGGFVKGANAYYFMTDQSTFDIDLRGLRVLRACDISDCASPCNFEALYEVRLNCGSDTFPQNSVICGLSVLDSFAGSSDTTVVLARCGTGIAARNRVCSFQLADIDNRMDTYFTQCIGGTGEIEVAWDGTERQCSSQFSAQGVCQFSPPLGDINARGSDPGSPVFGSRRLDFGDTEITASAAITVDSTSIVYVGYTNSSGNFIGEFYITSSSFLADPGSAFYTRSMSSPVRQLQWQSGLDYVYVATDSSVLRIPVEECASFTDCESCISYNNPLCGWCTVEDKCSRRSECQSATELERWVQGSSMCISTVVTPNQLVLDDPEILTVTVTPGLPPLLANERYWCQFADRGGGRTITVDAEEVTSNTEYTCDITGRIPAFTAAQLVTDFSFVSSDVGVPFATNVNALTVSRCNRCQFTMDLQVVRSTAAQFCLTPFEAVISGVTDVVLPAAQFVFEDPELTFFTEILHLTNEEIEQQMEDAIQHFSTTFGLDFSNVEPNDEQQRFLGNATFRPSRGPYNFTIVDNHWLVNGNLRSRCFKVGFGGFGVDFSGEMMLHGIYGGEEGLRVSAGAFVVYQYLFFFDVCPQQPILIQYQSLVPSHVLSVGWTVEEHQLNYRQLGAGRLRIVTKSRPHPDDPTFLVLENAIVLSFP